MDLARILKASRLFYRDHGLDQWRQRLPRKIDEAVFAGDLQNAERGGCTEAFAFPPFPFQMESFEQLVEQTARAPALSLPDSQQYHSEVFLADTWTKTANGKIWQRDFDLAGRESSSYLLFFSLTPLHNAWGRTGKQIAELFASKGWQGLTVPEYFVLQRFLAERHGDHRFLTNPEDDSAAHSLWLIDSMKDNACSVAVGKLGTINVQACPAGNRDSRRAALTALVVPLSPENGT